MNIQPKYNIVTSNLWLEHFIFLLDFNFFYYLRNNSHRRLYLLKFRLKEDLVNCPYSSDLETTNAH